jgi:hypothetical protein
VTNKWEEEKKKERNFCTIRKGEVKFTGITSHKRTKEKELKTER